MSLFHQLLSGLLAADQLQHFHARLWCICPPAFAPAALFALLKSQLVAAEPPPLPLSASGEERGIAALRIEAIRDQLLDMYERTRE